MFLQYRFFGTNIIGFLCSYCGMGWKGKEFSFLPLLLLYCFLKIIIYVEKAKL